MIKDSRERGGAPFGPPGRGETIDQPAGPDSPSRTRRRVRIATSAILLALLTFAPLWQVRNFSFLNLDDPETITANPQVKAGLSAAGLSWALRSSSTGNWHPLTWISLMADVSLFGLDPGPHHLGSALLHTASAALLFLVLAAATGAPWRSFLAAALFAVHPLRAESVAWVAERKDVLSVLLLMLTLAAWLRYARRPSPARYLLAALSFALGLAAKPMLVILPGALLILDFWPLGRFRRSGLPGWIVWWRLLLEKVPFAVMAVGAGLMTLGAQGGRGALWYFPLGERLANAASSYVLYLWKTIWPLRLAVHYPHLGAGLGAWQIAGAVLLLAAISISCVRLSGSRPYLAAGWAWYLGTLLPVIGIIQAGTQGMADRYSYIPHIGLFLLLSWWLGDLSGGQPQLHGAVVGCAILAIALLWVLDWRQVAFWKDDLTLFSHAVEIAPTSQVAHSQLGEALAAAGRNAEASTHYRRAFELNPISRAVVRVEAGNDALLKKRFAEARAHYQEALRILPPQMKEQIAQVRAAIAQAEAFEAQPRP